MIGTAEILVIAAVILILFGAASIPKFARSLGQAKAEFEKGVAEGAAKTAKSQSGKSKASSSGKKRKS